MFLTYHPAPLWLPMRKDGHTTSGLKLRMSLSPINYRNDLEVWAALFPCCDNLINETDRCCAVHRQRSDCASIRLNIRRRNVPRDQFIAKEINGLIRLINSLRYTPAGAEGGWRLPLVPPGPCTSLPPIVWRPVTFAICTEFVPRYFRITIRV